MCSFEGYCLEYDINQTVALQAFLYITILIVYIFIYGYVSSFNHSKSNSKDCHRSSLCMQLIT